MTRKLLLASVALLVVAVSLHATRDTARGQAFAGIVGAGWCQTDQHAYAVDTGGAIYTAAGGYCGSWSQVGQLPIGQVPAEVLSDVGGKVYVLCRGGNVYDLLGTYQSVEPSLCSNVLGGMPVPTATRANWGALKARYK